MILYLLLLPIAEVFFTLMVADEIGFLETVYWVILAFFFGLMLLRVTGMNLPLELQKQAQKGQSGNATLMRSAMRFIAGVLFMIPGLLSDVVACVFLLLSFTPFLDRLMADWVRRSFKSRVVFTSYNPGPQQGPFRAGMEDHEPFARPPMKDVTPQKPDELPESTNKTDQNN